MSTNRLTDEQRRNLRRNLSPELYEAIKRLRAAARKYERSVTAHVEVQPADVLRVLAEIERIYCR